MDCAQELFWKFSHPRRIRSDQENEFLVEFGVVVGMAGAT